MCGGVRLWLLQANPKPTVNLLLYETLKLTLTLTLTVILFLCLTLKLTLNLTLKLSLFEIIKLTISLCNSL